MPSTTQKQREYRQSLKDRGYRRLDIQISPALFEKLRPHLSPHYGEPYAGAALVVFLEKLMNSGTLGTNKKT